MMTLIDAFGSVDAATVTFLLDALDNTDAEDDWEAILEPFVDDSSAALAVLVSDPLAVKKAREAFRRNSSVRALSAGVACASLESLTCTKIDGAENRAISLSQLRRLVAFIDLHADAGGALPWHDRDERSPTHGARLRADSMNLYHVVDWIVKPMTASNQCSFVEMLADAPQRPRFFVSHAWGEPVRDLVTMVAKHAEVRDLSEDEHWWICGYANNQHLEDSIVDPDPKKTSFYLAMQQCEGVLLCLDALATPFKRIWCCFEEAMTVRGEKKLLLDIATVVSGEGVVLTDGFVKADLRDGEQYALEFKRDREKIFPLQLLERGYDIDIRYADAAYRKDKQRILNTIAGDVPTAEIGIREPDITHPSFAVVNNTLHGIFAEAAVRKAADANRLELPIQILTHDTERTALTLNLGGCRNIDASALRNLAGGSLKKLIIDFNCSNISDMSNVGRALAGLPHLAELRLSMAWCAMLHDAAPLATEFASLNSLTDLRLDFTSCDFSVVLPGIEHLEMLECLFVDYSYTHTKELQNIFELKNLRNLTLLCKGCQQLTHENAFFGLGQLIKLEEMSLDFSYSGFSTFPPEMNELKSLEKLSIDFSYTRISCCCDNMQKTFGLTNLRELTLHFKGCTQLTNAHKFSWMGRLNRLAVLTIDFSFSRLAEADGLRAIGDVSCLSACSLCFVKCVHLTDVTSWLPQAVSSVSQLDVDFSECKGLAQSLQARFLSWDAISNSWCFEVDSDPDSQLSTAQTYPPSKLIVGDSVNYYSKYNRCWLPAVVRHVYSASGKGDSVKVEFMAEGHCWKSPRIRASDRSRIRWEKEFEVGDTVEYFSKHHCCWLPAVVRHVCNESGKGNSVKVEYMATGRCCKSRWILASDRSRIRWENKR